MTENKQSYDESQIQVLEGLEAVRKRPGMYIGTTSSRGLHHLVYEIVDNSIDEALAGFCSHIEVTINEDNSITVVDNGRGMPVGIHPKIGRSTIEVIMTVLHAGGKFGGGGYKVSGGLHGVGASVVNALSEACEVTVTREGKVWQQKYSRGNILGDVTQIGESDGHGTKTWFKPDHEIFETTEFEFEILQSRLRELAFLNKGIRITLSDKREGQEKGETYYYEGGIKEFVNYLNRNKDVLHPEPIYVEGEKDGIIAEVSLQYNDGYTENLYSFANNIDTIEGGTHLVGFKTAITRVINDYAKKFGHIKESDKNLSGDDVREGLTAVVSVKISEPQFEGQTKTKLGNSEVRGVVDSIVADGVGTFLEENPAVGKIIIDKALMAARARDAARKARELTRKSVLERSTLPGKLADCSSKDPMECEIYMGKVDTERQALNCFRMELLGAKVHPVVSGTMTLKDAVNEAMREWTRRVDDTLYVLGSVMGPHPFPTIVRDFQSVISKEIKEQLMEKDGKLPDAVIACVGGGSNAMGAFYNFIEDKSVKLIGCEAAGLGVDTPKNAASVANGAMGIFHGMKSLFCQDKYGQIAPVYSISAGLDYPGIGPEHAMLNETGRAQYVSITDDEAVNAFEYLSRTEGIIPAIESSHAIAYAMKYAPTLDKDKIIVVNVSGRGDKDVAAIARYRGVEIYE